MRRRSRIASALSNLKMVSICCSKLKASMNRIPFKLVLLNADFTSDSIASATRFMLCTVIPISSARRGCAGDGKEQGLPVFVQTPVYFVTQSPEKINFSVKRHIGIAVFIVNKTLDAMKQKC